MLLRPLVVVALLAPTAEARDVKTGTTARVTRTRSADTPMILWAMVDGQSDVRIIALDGWLQPRTYAIVDEGGVLGLVGVEKVEKDRSCRNFTYESIRGRMTSRTGRATTGTPLAIGPVKAAPPKAKVVYPYNERDLPPAGMNELYGAIDLDGDDRSDLIRYVYECDKGRRRRPGAPDHCVEIWSRSGGEPWRKTLEGSFPPCL